MTETFILPNFQFDDIFQITELDCLKLRDSIGKLEYSTVYKNTIICIFKQIMKTAHKFYKLNPDPSYVVDRFRKTRQEKVEQRNRDINIWTIEVFSKFIIKVKDRKYKLFFSVLYFTGLRLGEALALKWSDRHDEIISVNKSITRKTDKGSFEIKEPKTTSSVRAIRINIFGIA